MVSMFKCSCCTFSAKMKRILNAVTGVKIYDQLKESGRSFGQLIVGRFDHRKNWTKEHFSCG